LTLKFQPLTLNPQPLTLNPQPSTLNPTALFFEHKGVRPCCVGAVANDCDFAAGVAQLAGGERRRDGVSSGGKRGFQVVGAKDRVKGLYIRVWGLGFQG